MGTMRTTEAGRKELLRRKLAKGGIVELKGSRNIPDGRELKNSYRRTTAKQRKAETLYFHDKMGNK